MDVNITVALTYKKHTSCVNTVAITRNAKYILSGSDDGSVIVFNTETKTVLHKLTTKRDSVICIALSDDETFVVVGSDDGTAIIWDYLNDIARHTFNYGSPIWSLAISKDNSKLVTCGDVGDEQSNITVWDIMTQKLIKEFNHNRTIYNVVFAAADGSKVIFADRLSKIHLRDVITNNIQHVVTCPATVFSLTLAHDWTTLFTGLINGSIIRWNLNTGVREAIFTDHSDWVMTIALNNDETKLISGSYNHQIKIWDIATGMCEYTLNQHTDIVRAVAMCGRGNCFVSGSSDKSVVLWNVSTLEC